MLKKEETILRQILWGERPINHLHFVKIKLVREGKRYLVENSRHLSIDAEIYDIARGIRSHKDELPKLQEWARFVFFTEDLFGLNLHRCDTGRAFHKALKDLAEGGPLDPEILEKALELVPELPEKKFLGE